MHQIKAVMHVQVFNTVQQVTVLIAGKMGEQQQQKSVCVCVCVWGGIAESNANWDRSNKRGKVADEWPREWQSHAETGEKKKKHKKNCAAPVSFDAAHKVTGLKFSAKTYKL